MSTDTTTPSVTLPTYETILYETEGKVAIVTLNRPEKRNAMTEQMNKDLVDAFHHIKERKDVSVVILKGAGPSFCSGHDLNEWNPEALYALEDEFFLEQRKVLDRFLRYRKMLWELPQPVIVQIQGYCLTTGIELSMNCDLVVVADDAKIAVRTVGGSGLYFHLWPWMVGVRKTKELLFTGRWVGGEEAARLGIANTCYPIGEIDEKVMAMAQQIANVPLSFLTLDKQCCNKALDLMGAREAVEYSAQMHAVSHTTKDSHDRGHGLHEADWKKGVAERDARYQND